MFPNARPDRREDATLLAHWLAEMVGQLSSYQAQALMAQVSTRIASPVWWGWSLAKEASVPPVRSMGIDNWTFRIRLVTAREDGHV